MAMYYQKIFVPFFYYSCSVMLLLLFLITKSCRTFQHKYLLQHFKSSKKKKWIEIRTTRILKFLRKLPLKSSWLERYLQFFLKYPLKSLFILFVENLVEHFSIFFILCLTFVERFDIYFTLLLLIIYSSI